MKLLIATAIVSASVALSSMPAQARCVSGNPYDLRCRPSDFLQPTMADQLWWAQQSQTARATMLFNCTHYRPGVAPPPIAWCRAAGQAQLASAGHR